MPMDQHAAYIGIGSNIGDRFSHLQEALRRMSELEGTTISAASRIYETEPVGEEEQNRFYNGVVLINTALEPEDLRRSCKKLNTNSADPKPTVAGARGSLTLICSFTTTAPSAPKRSTFPTRNCTAASLCWFHCSTQATPCTPS